MPKPYPGYFKNIDNCGFDIAVNCFKGSPPGNALVIARIEELRDGCQKWLDDYCDPEEPPVAGRKILMKINGKTIEITL